MKITFKELLDMPVEQVHTEITWLADSYYNHYHFHKHEFQYDSNEFDFFTKDYIDPEFVKKQDRIKVHVLKDFQFNIRYIWRLFYVTFDDVPCMICCNACREGDDHAENTILNMEAYLKLHHYVFGNMKPYIR